MIHFNWNDIDSEFRFDCSKQLSYYSKSCNLVTNIIWCQLQCKIGTIASLSMDLTRQHSIPRGVFLKPSFNYVNEKLTV